MPLLQNPRPVGELVINPGFFGLVNLDAGDTFAGNKWIQILIPFVIVNMVSY